MTPRPITASDVQWCVDRKLGHRFSVHASLKDLSCVNTHCWPDQTEWDRDPSNLKMMMVLTLARKLKEHIEKVKKYCNDTINLETNG